MTDGQVIALIAVTFITSILSTVGSSIIVYLVLMAKKSSVYNRMMLGMSMFDILNSLFNFIHPFLLPAEGGRISAYGNNQTCAMLGFVVQLGMSVPLYNISLNAYFLAAVVFGVSEVKFQKYAEPSLHAISILFPLATASVGAGLSLYSEKELGLFCWIGDIPKGCREDPTVPCIDPTISFLFGGLPLAASIFFLLISNGMIYWKVRSTGRKSEKYRETKYSSTTHAVVVAVVNDPSLEEQCTSATNSINTNNNNNTNISNNRSDDVYQTDAESRSSIGFVKRTWEFFRTHLTCRKNTNPSAVTVAGKRRSREYQQARAVAVQATLYVSACFASLIGLVAMTIPEGARVNREQESDIYWLLVLTCVTLPLQGFLNGLVFIRPRYLRWRRASPTRSRLWALKQCLSNTVSPHEARAALRRESQKLECNEPVIPASDSLSDLQTNPALCAGDNGEDVV